MNDSTITLNDFYLIASTDKAILIRDCDERKVWIPRSKIIDIIYGKDLKDTETGLPVKEIRSIEIPEWLASNNDLI